jgi:membrane protease YdiL (CAAX protease family)
MTWEENEKPEIDSGSHDLPQDAAETVVQTEVENPLQPAGKGRRDPSYPGIGQAIKLLLLLFLLQVLLTLPIAALRPTLHPAATAGVSLCSTAIIIAWGVRRTGASFREVMPLGAVRPSVLAALVVTVVGLSVLLSELGNMLQSVLPPPAWFAETMADLIGGKKSLWGSILLASIVAPVTEEPLFRGLILRGFLARYRVGTAIASSALLFALFHLNPWQFAAGAATGVLFAWCFVKTRSLVPCLFGHAVNNSLGWIFVALHLEVPGYTGDWTEGIKHQPLWFDALGLLLAAAGIMWLARSFRSSGESACRIPPY